MISVILLCLCGLCLVYGGLVWRQKRRRLLELASLTPTLKNCFPIVGNALVLQGDSEKLWKTFKRIMKEATDAGGVLAVWLGPSLHYMITDPDDAATILNTCLEKNRYIYDMGTCFLGTSLINTGVSRWKRNRKLLNPSFSKILLDRFQGVFNEESKRLVRSLEPLAGKGQTKILYQISDAAIQAVSATVLGISESNESLINQKYKYAIKNMFSLLSRRISNVLLHSEIGFSLSPLKKTERELVTTLHEQSLKIITQRKKERAAEKEDSKPTGHRFQSFLDLLLDFGENELFKDYEIRDELNSLISAGYDTLANALPYSLMLIGSYPEVQKKVQEEILAVVGRDADVTKYHDMPYLDAVLKESMRLYPSVPIVSRDCHEDVKLILAVVGRDADVTKYHDMPYLDAVLKESMRLYPSVPIVSRDCHEDVKLKNYTLPAGCHCTIGIWGIQRLPIWGPDVEQFRPERWLDPESLPKSPGAYCTFSVGKRNCIGKSYSMLFCKTVLIYVVRRFRISADISKLKLKFEIMLNPASGDTVALELREN